MTNIKNVTLEFNCTEKLGDKLFCDKCSHSVVDFTTKTTEELQEQINKSLRPVCGIFKKSQLSDQFLRYAAATFIATSLTIPSLGQEVINGDSLLKTCEKVAAEGEEDTFFGLVVETQAEPVGGYQKFIEAIANKMKYPKGLTEKGKSFVEFTVDSLGQMKDVKLVRGFNELADAEAVRVLASLDYPFTPGRQSGVPIKTRLVMPISFDPKKSVKR